jgi:hypothetical protein
MKALRLVALGFGLLVVLPTAVANAMQEPEPLRIQLVRGDRDLELLWNAPGLLERAVDVRGPWTLVEGAVSPFRIAPKAGPSFYRVQRLQLLSVSRSGAGTGEIRSVPAGIQCGDDCTQALPTGRSVVLQAVPGAGSRFAGWSGDCTGTGECQVTLDQARSVTAEFVPAPPDNPILNGDFEMGPGVGWAQHPGTVIFPAGNLGGAPPFSGQYSAFLGFDRDDRRLVQLGQRVTLPARSPLFLNFAAWIYSEELCDVPWYDQITLYLNGTPVYRDDRVCRSSGTGGWVKSSVEVSALAGQSVAIVFEISSADVLASVLLLDDIALSDRAWGL